jgi:uncharacterized protein YebE (UPF0316 family)
MKLFVIFVLLNILNVIIQTVKSICTIKCGKVTAAVSNAVAYGLYTVVIVYMVCDLPLYVKVIVVGLCNLIGVYVVKAIEEHKRKDQIWKVEATINKGDNWKDLDNELSEKNISHNYIDVKKWIVFNCYCNNKKESEIVRTILKNYNARYFVSETKNL